MKNREEILGKINELTALSGDINSVIAELIGKQQLYDDEFGELIELIEEPICYRLYLENGSKSMVVSWAIDEKNIPEKLICDNGYLIPVNNNNASPDIYGIGENEKDAILEYKMCYLEEKFNFFKEY